MPSRKYSDEQLNEAADLREQGLSYASIGKRLSMSSGAVSWHCLRLGADSPNTVSKLPQYNGPMTMARGNHVIQRFTSDEDKILLEMDIKGNRLCDMAKCLNRKANSVRGRLMILARKQERELHMASQV